MKVFQDPIVYMFSYGMNTNTTQMLLRCRSAYPLGYGTLFNHQFDFRYHADIQHTGNHQDMVHGMTWEISKEDLEAIDILEGYPVYYTRKAVHIDVWKYMGVTAWVYEMVNKSSLEFPDARYYDCLMEGYQQNGIPTQQINDALDRCEQEAVLIERNYGY